MDIQDLYKMKAHDAAEIRRDRTDWEASRIPVLHDKWLRLLHAEKLELKRMERGMASLIKVKREYYLGKASPEVYKEQPFDLKVKAIKTEVGTYLDADSQVQEVQDLIDQQELKVEYLEKTLAEISNRGFRIANIIESQKFRAGLSRHDMKFDMDDDDLKIS
jgi:hypothetical protein